jgi:hypothetical protein
MSTVVMVTFDTSRLERKTYVEQNPLQRKLP